MPGGRKARKKSGVKEFLATPMYALVDRHRELLERIKTFDDAEYWGHILIGEHYPDIPKSRVASGKLAALVGLTDYLDFYCAPPEYYELLKEGKSLRQARRLVAARMKRRAAVATRALVSGRKNISRIEEVRVRVGPNGRVVIPRLFRDALKIHPGTEITFSREGDKIVIRGIRTDAVDVFERIARAGKTIRKVPPHDAYEGELESRRS